MAFSYLTNKIGVLDLDRLYGVLDIVVDVISIAGLAPALRAPGGRKRMLVIASTFLPVVLCTCPGCTEGKCEPGDGEHVDYDVENTVETVEVENADLVGQVGEGHGR